jgi:hypothetical protein
MRRAAATAAVVSRDRREGERRRHRDQRDVTVLRVNAAVLKNAYTTKKLTAVAGKIGITLNNTGYSPHNIAIGVGTKASSRVIAKGPITILHGATSLLDRDLAERLAELAEPVPSRLRRLGVHIEDLVAERPLPRERAAEPSDDAGQLDGTKHRRAVGVPRPGL